MSYAPKDWVLPEPDVLTLDDIIGELEKLDHNTKVRLGFSNPHSYRGYYEQLAFEPVENTTVGDMLSAAESAYGATFEGWKGGDYTMDAHTECWLAFRGDCGEPVGRILLSLLVGSWLKKADDPDA